MTKAELIAKVAGKVGTTKAQAERCINAMVEAMIEAFEKGERIALPSLGTFNVKKRARRKGINPQTGKEIVIPERKVVVFSMSKNLKKKINK